jgi:uncharacterized membrane protein
MDLVLVVAVWLHTLAFVIAWGYYGILARMILPGLGRSLDLPARVATLRAIEGRALPLVLLSVALFVVTGTYMLVVDPQYAGLGNFDSTWTKLMLFKHVLVIGLVALGAGIDYLIRGMGEDLTDTANASDLRLVRLGAEAATGLGALIALLTVAAQLAA